MQRSMFTLVSRIDSKKFLAYVSIYFIFYIIGVGKNFFNPLKSGGKKTN